MISKMSKWVFPIIILFILHNAISQEYKNLYSYKDNKPLYDMDGLPIWTDSLGYITLKGDTIARSNLQSAVCFDKGKDGFSNYIDSCYYNSPMYNYEDFHFSITFHIIFNDNMDIEEVRLVGSSSSYITPRLRSYLVDCVFKTDDGFSKGKLTARMLMYKCVNCIETLFIQSKIYGIFRIE